MRTKAHTAWMLLLVSGASVAEVPLDPRTAKPSERLLRELEREGVTGDVESVIDAALTHPDFAVRSTAVDLLGQRGDHEAAEALRRIVALDEVRLVREAAAVALVRLGHREFLDEVREFMVTEESSSHRLKLAADLAQLGDFSGYEFVVDATRSEDTGLRYDSVGIVRMFLLAEFSGGEMPAPHELLIHLLRDRSKEVRARALRHVSIAVAQGAPLFHFLDSVTAMAEEDPDPDIRESARSKLRSWKRRLELDGDRSSRGPVDQPRSLFEAIHLHAANEQGWPDGCTGL